MKKKSTQDIAKSKIYPRMRYMLTLGRKINKLVMKINTIFSKRPTSSTVIPDNYTTCNTSTIDSDMKLNCLEGEYPKDIDGSLFFCQCLGTPEAFMVGDTNIIRMDFDEYNVHLTNRRMWTPAAIARMNLKETIHRFDYLGLMYLSPGMGLFSYTEGMYLLPDGRIAVTSDVDRPWAIDRESLRAVTPVGRRDEWLPMMSGKSNEVMGELFAGYSNSHVVYTDFEQEETFLVTYQLKQDDDSHPVKLIRWDGYNDFENWRVTDVNGKDIEIKQSIHELVFTRDYIILADTAFVTGEEMLMPWKNSPLPYEKTMTYIVDRRELASDKDTVIARRLEIDEPCIHLIPEYENPNDEITLYMLHTPATNTAEILRSDDRDLSGRLFPENTIGYGTLPVLDLSSVGKHIIDAKKSIVKTSKHIAEMPYCWGPYLYTYMGRQTKPFKKQDLFVMFKGFSKDILPKRIFEAYKDIDNRRVPIDEMINGNGIQHNNSICRIKTDDFKIADSYIFPEKVLLYTISCLDSKEDDGSGYVIAGVVTDDMVKKETSGHEYWLFDGNNLAKGPICKLGNELLNNSTIFHTVYIQSKIENELNKKKETYRIPLREDYSEREVMQWDKSVLQTFNDIIWPYYDEGMSADKESAEKIINQLAARGISEHWGKEELIGEERVIDAPKFAERMIYEVERMWQTSGWKTESSRNGLIIESKPISGALEESGILVTRCVGEINASAQETFDMLTSPKGYAVIDPISKPEDHEIPPLEVYEWMEGCRLEAAIATTNLPGMPEGEFVVLNAINPKDRIFVSKSILHDNAPGGSKYSDELPPSNGRERALNTFAIKIEAINDNLCRVYSINYADMVWKTSATMNNLFNTKMFFKPLYTRISKAMQEY